MAECKDHENCAANEEIRTNSRLEKELSQCEADNRERGFQLLNQLKQIKQLDEQIYRKQITLHLPSSCIAQNNAADLQVEQDQDDEQTTQKHIEQMLTNFEHTIHKATKDEEDDDEDNETQKHIDEMLANFEHTIHKTTKDEEEDDEDNETQKHIDQMLSNFEHTIHKTTKDEEEDDEDNETQKHIDQMLSNFEHTIHKATKDENEEENETKDKEENEENKTKDGEQIPRSDFGNCAAGGINDVCSFRWSNSKSPNNECSGGVEEGLNPGGIDNEEKRITACADFKSKQLHFEKLIQREIIITEQEINKRQRLLKK